MCKNILQFYCPSSCPRCLAKFFANCFLLNFYSPRQLLIMRKQLHELLRWIWFPIKPSNLISENHNESVQHFFADHGENPIQKCTLFSPPLTMILCSSDFLLSSSYDELEDHHQQHPQLIQRRKEAYLVQHGVPVLKKDPNGVVLVLTAITVNLEHHWTHVVERAQMRSQLDVECREFCIIRDTNIFSIKINNVAPAFEDFWAK